MKKILFFFLFISFFSLGYFFDVSNKITKKQSIFSLSNEKTERYRKAVLLDEYSYSSNKTIYFCTNKYILDLVFNKDKILKNKKEYLKKVKLIQNSKNTFEEIQNIEKEMIEKNINSAIIVTDPPHTLRVKIFIELFTTKLKKDYIIVSTEPNWWNKYFYFTNWYAIKFVFLELIKIPYNLIKYGLILS